jgi:hypothetical protein
MTARPERRVVNVDGLDGCSITVREPTNRERYAQHAYANEVVGFDASNADWLAARLEYRFRVIVDWSGFNGEDGQPLQFNPKTFNMALAQSEALQEAAAIAVREAFEGIPERDAKNSDTPSSNG